MFSFSSKKADRRREMTSLATHSLNLNLDLDLSPRVYLDQTSFRIGGRIEGEIDLLCRSLGLSGPDDFAIPAAVWEASLKARSSSHLVVTSENVQNPSEMPGIGGGDEMKMTNSSPGGSVLARPPFMRLPVLDGMSSTWDLVKSFAPPDENNEGCERKSEEEDEEEEVRVGAGEVGAILEKTSEGCTGLFSTSNDDDSLSTMMESRFFVSPNHGIKRIVGSWMRGQLLGRGSFGTVYEGISE